MTLNQLKSKVRKLEQAILDLRSIVYSPKPTVKDTVLDQGQVADIWLQAREALKGKLPKNPVAWQKRIRKEWDERFKRETAQSKK